MISRILVSQVALAQSPAKGTGVHISDVKPLQNLQVRTQNNPYSLYVLDPSKNRVLVRGGQFFPEYKEAHLCGSTWGGSMLWTGWIGLGMCMEILVDGLRIVTTPLQSITIHDSPSQVVN